MENPLNFTQTQTHHRLRFPSSDTLCPEPVPGGALHGLARASL